MPSTEWGLRERRLVVATAVAPLAVVTGVAALAVLFFGPEAIFLSVALIPLAYFTLFLFVLPSLWLLRRSRLEGLWSFCLVCGSSTLVPWFVIYSIFFSTSGAESSKYSGAPLQVLTLLLVPAVLATVSAAAVYRLFGRRPGENGV